MTVGTLVVSMATWTSLDSGLCAISATGAGAIIEVRESHGAHQISGLKTFQRQGHRI